MISKKNIKLIIFLILLTILGGQIYATVTTASSRKSQKLPWQGVISSQYDSAHNVGTTYSPQNDFTMGDLYEDLIDNRTGLGWHTQHSSINSSWDNAKNYCQTSIIGGYNDWRLPNIRELLTIYNYSTTYLSDEYKYVISGGDHFPSDRLTNAGDCYWSNTTAGISSTEAIAVYGNLEVGGRAKTLTCRTICVRDTLNTNLDGSITTYIPDANNIGRFECHTSPCPSSNGVVFDKLTGLYWESQKGGTYTWANAKSYCASLNLGGYTDWRLPDYTELQSIVDYYRKAPSIDASFFASATDRYWSSTTYAAYGTTNAWIVYFNYGNANYTSKTVNSYVRCTR